MHKDFYHCFVLKLAAYIHYYAVTTTMKTDSCFNFKSHDGDEHSHTSGQQSTDAVNNLFIEIIYAHNYVYHMHYNKWKTYRTAGIICEVQFLRTIKFAF